MMPKNNEQEAVYREELLEYYKHPSNKHEIPDANIRKKDSNPLCGDEIEIFIKLNNDRQINDISFTGHGCVISMATASLLMEHLQGKNIDEIKNMSRDDLMKMLGIRLTTSRVKCAMLSLNTLKKGVIEYESKVE